MPSTITESILQGEQTQYLVRVTNPLAGININGLIHSESIDYSTSSNWGVSPIATGIDKAASLFGAGLISGVHTILETLKGYESSEPLSLSIPMTIIPNRLGMGDYRDIELMLSKLTQSPIPSQAESVKDYFQRSYLYDYEAYFDALKKIDSINSIQRGLFFLDDKLLSLKMGTHFETPSVFYIKSVDRNLSSLVTEENTPLFMNVTIHLESYRILSAEEISRFHNPSLFTSLFFNNNREQGLSESINAID